MRVVSLVALLLPLLATSSSGAEARNNRSRLTGHYFVVVWGYQGSDNDLVQAHTFISFYKGDDLSRGIVKPATISWLPATGVVEPFGSEPGRNFTCPNFAYGMPVRATG